MVCTAAFGVTRPDGLPLAALSGPPDGLWPRPPASTAVTSRTTAKTAREASGHQLGNRRWSPVGGIGSVAPFAPAASGTGSPGSTPADTPADTSADAPADMARAAAR